MLTEVFKLGAKRRHVSDPDVDQVLSYELALARRGSDAYALIFDVQEGFSSFFSEALSNNTYAVVGLRCSLSHEGDARV